MPSLPSPSSSSVRISAAFSGGGSYFSISRCSSVQFSGSAGWMNLPDQIEFEKKIFKKDWRTKKGWDFVFEGDGSPHFFSLWRRWNKGNRLGRFSNITTVCHRSPSQWSFPLRGSCDWFCLKEQQPPGSTHCYCLQIKSRMPVYRDEANLRHTAFWYIQWDAGGEETWNSTPAASLHQRTTRDSATKAWLISSQTSRDRNHANSVILRLLKEEPS